MIQLAKLVSVAVKIAAQNLPKVRVTPDGDFSACTGIWQWVPVASGSPSAKQMLPKMVIAQL